MQAIHKDGFIPYQTKGFTFGFEIEGFFHKRIVKQLAKGGLFKQDGSVRSDGLTIDREDLAECTEGREGRADYATEYNSPVFKSIDELVEQLKLFSPKLNPGNYQSNNSCGVHLHIGYKQKNVLANKFRTKEMIEQLQKQFLPLVCDCVKKRIEARQWCNLHDFFRNNRVDGYAKYHAVNFHSSGTIELRLFGPCNHLIGNIQKVLTEFFRVGYRDFNCEPQPITCIVTKGEKVSIVETLTVEPKSYKYGFDKNSIYALSPLARMADEAEYTRLSLELSTYRNF